MGLNVYITTLGTGTFRYFLTRTDNSEIHAANWRPKKTTECFTNVASFGPAFEALVNPL